MLGVLSNQALVTMYSALLAQLNPAVIPGSTTDVLDVLRSAYVDSDPDSRLAAMENLWTEDSGADGRYASLILTARAAVRVQPSREAAGLAGGLIAAMLTAGLDLQAERWAQFIDAKDDDQAWALLAVGTPNPSSVDISFARLEDYAQNAGSAGQHRARLLAAALAGLGRLDKDEINDAERVLSLDLSQQNIWTRQLERVARGRWVGLVALISAIGMQTDSWSGVPPYHLYHIVRAFRLAGREPEARMIAAEALTRT